MAALPHSPLLSAGWGRGGRGRRADLPSPAFTSAPRRCGRGGGGGPASERGAGGLGTCGIGRGERRQQQQRGLAPIPALSPGTTRSRQAGKEEGGKRVRKGPRGGGWWWCFVGFVCLCLHNKLFILVPFSQSLGCHLFVSRGVAVFVMYGMRHLAGGCRPEHPAPACTGTQPIPCQF